MTTKTTFNDLVQYINSGHPLDPVPVRQEREQLAAMLNDLGTKLNAGDSFEFEFTGKIVATVHEGQVDVKVVGTNGNARAGDICNALMSLDGQPQDALLVCPGCGNHFVSQKGTKKYCNDGCARRVWNSNAKERRQAGTV
ncbi:hypothetical protein ACHHRT_12460 [Desulfurivibrio sp. D14AmB]|uniref:hypothetical protein n=1 Tax=Desulfurivibrio sp. D14AmB TaxID=3374370 RepID=UPI00376F3AC1